MDTRKRFAGLALVAIAAVTAAYFLASQFLTLDPSRDEVARTVWRVLHPFIALGLIIVFVEAWQRKRRVDADPDRSVSREWVETNGVFYLAAALALATIWNWVGSLYGAGIEDRQLWTLTYIVSPILMAATGLRMSREANQRA